MLSLSLSLTLSLSRCLSRTFVCKVRPGYRATCIFFLITTLIITIDTRARLWLTYLYLSVSLRSSWWYLCVRTQSATSQPARCPTWIWLYRTENVTINTAVITKRKLESSSTPALALLTNIVFISHQHPPPVMTSQGHPLGDLSTAVLNQWPGGQSLSII